METVHVFGGIDGFQDTLGIYLRGKRKLNENAIHIVVAIQVLDDGKQVESGYRGGWRDERARERQLFARGGLALDIELRGGIFTDKNCSKARPHTGGRKQANFVFQLGEDLVTNLSAVEDACGHAVLAFARAGGAKENHSTRKKRVSAFRTLGRRPILLASHQFARGGTHGHRKANRAGISVQGRTCRIRDPWVNRRDLHGTVFHDGAILGKFDRRRSTRRACVGLWVWPRRHYAFPDSVRHRGGVAGVVGAAVYNLAAGWVGGLEVDIS